MIPTPSRAAARHCIAAALLLAGLLGGLSACGNDDLLFPGDVPATPTSSNTATPTPDN